jgi:hypothetical protein
MYEKEIYEQSWIVSDKLQIRSIDLVNLSIEERECHINILDQPLKNDLNTIVYIDSTSQKYITKLKKSSLFTLTEILVSERNKKKDLGRYILSIKGEMSPSGITIRKSKVKRKSFTEEQKEDLKKRLGNP